jgi:CubicO group peptidase (beta-lactamase class C family)
MGELQVSVDPTEVGLDPGRLARIGTHLRRYVDDGRLPGWTVVVTRSSEVAYLEHCGARDLESGAPVEGDTIFRAYSMTKPITAVAALQLWEEGAFELNDPVRRFIPSFADARVWRGGSVTNPVTEPLTEELRVWHLLTHTAGLTYGFLYAHPVDDLYRRQGYEWGVPPGVDLASACDAWASLPLLFQPGREWNYSVATDVLGRVVEVAAGRPLDQVLRERVLDPLGMVDTHFSVPPDEQYRLAALYMPQPGTRKAVRLDAMGNAALQPPAFLSGGGGLVTTAQDYQRFASMLLHRGVLDDVRLLGTRTVEYLATNHLPGGADLTEFGRPLFAETTFDGVGFGLGVSVTQDPVKAKVPGSFGDFGWGGAASTYFVVDPLEELTILFLTQLLPSSTWPLRSQLKTLVHQALID